MTREPTLFDELAAQPDERRLGVPRLDRSLCPADREWIAMADEDGIPCDLSTVEYACELLVLLWRERSTWLGLVDELLGAGQ